MPQRYSSSGTPNPNWSRAYSPEQKILEHLESVIVSKGLLPHIQYCAKIIECVWDDEFEEYDIVVEHSPPSDDNDEPAARGAEIERLKAAVVILPSGTLHISNMHPNIPKAGLENFKGDWWHAAQWRHDISSKNKKVGVVGTSCCAVQGFRAIDEDDSTQVVHFCRDSSWFVPRVSSHRAERESHNLIRPLVLSSSEQFRHSNMAYVDVRSYPDYFISLQILHLRQGIYALCQISSQ